MFQEITVNPSLTVAENIFAGQLRAFRRAGLLFAGALQRRAQEILDGFGAGISVRQPLSALDLGQWKCIEIARALSTDPRAVFLDESTAFLNHREVDAVLGAMRALKARGLAVAFVSHHLAEVEAVADRLTILKDGRKVGDFRAGELDRGGIQTRMVGREMAAAAPVARTPIADTEPVLAFRGCRRGRQPRAPRPRPAPRRDRGIRRPQGGGRRARPGTRRRRRPGTARGAAARGVGLPPPRSRRRLGVRRRLPAGRTARPKA